MAKRKIKFRGKQVDNGKWAFGDLTKIEGHEDGKDYKKTVILEALKYDDYNGYVYQFIPASVVDPETVDQYTGLKDKNGAEIYGGDIVEFSYGGVVRAYVRSDNGAYNVVNEKGDVLLYLYVINHKARIIGNIYENSELLRKKE